MSFLNQFYNNENVLSEAGFSSKPGYQPLLKLPKFTVLKSDFVGDIPPKTLSLLESALLESRNKIANMGFPSMHCFVLITNIEIANPTTGKSKGVTALALKYSQHIELDYGFVLRANKEKLVNNIVHEWGHLWMFNRSKQFKASVEELYRELLSSGKQKMLQDPEPIRNAVENETKNSRETDRFLNKISSSVQNVIDSNDEIQSFIKSKGKQKSISSDTEKEIFDSIWNNFEKYDIADKESMKYVKMVSKLVFRQLKATKPSDIMQLKSNSWEYLWLFNDFKGSELPTLTSIFNQKRLSGRTQQYYNKYSSKLSLPEGETLRNLISILEEWPTSYGILNQEELWATAMEKFDRLPENYKQKIIGLMQYR